MKKLFPALVACLLLVSCGQNHKTETNKIAAELRFPPPIVAKDDEIAEKDLPTVEQLQVADPGPKDKKGDPGTAVRIDEPVSNSDTKSYYRSARGSTQDFSKKVIKQGDISFETGNITQTRKTILASLKRAGGYVSEENESNNSDENRKEYILKVQIPAKNFDTFLNDVSSAAVQIDSKNISSRDVTTQYIDIATRLQNRQLLETRYLALLKQANNMGDILKIENKLSQIQSEIESEQGQLNYMSKQVAYSSLDITFYTRHIAPADKGYGPQYKFQKALGEGWDAVTGLFFGFIAMWPLVPAVGLLVFVFKKWRRRNKVAMV